MVQMARALTHPRLPPHIQLQVSGLPFVELVQRCDDSSMTLPFLDLQLPSLDPPLHF